MFTDEERKNMDWRERVWGYTGGAGMIQGMAAGYFLWDLVITIQHVKLFGPGMLAHAISALLVFSFGFVSILHRQNHCTLTVFYRDRLSTTMDAPLSSMSSPRRS
jgi:hypothetical protein